VTIFGVNIPSGADRGRRRPEVSVLQLEVRHRKVLWLFTTLASATAQPCDSGIVKPAAPDRISMPKNDNNCVRGRLRRKIRQICRTNSTTPNRFASSLPVGDAPYIAVWKCPQSLLCYYHLLGRKCEQVNCR
jgi:hypothetical protein